LTRGTSSHELSASRSPRDRNKSRGQSLVEFAIFIPVLVTILLVAVDVGRVYLGWVNLSNVARIGANFAAQNPTAWEGGGDSLIQARYRTLMGKDASGIDCSLPSTLPAPTFPDTSDPYALGSRVRVDLSCNFSLITPFLSNLVGDGAGHISVGYAAIFTIRTGSVDGVVINGAAATGTPTAAPTSTLVSVATPTLTPTDTPTPEPTSTRTLAPGETPTPTPDPTETPTPTPVATPLTISFYGESTSTDASGGGPPGSTDENQIVGIPTLAVTFHNTTNASNPGGCLWDFGDGATSNSCGNNVDHSYTDRGTFNVTLTIDGYALTRSNYVLVGCKVPAFAGVHENSAATNWTNAGFVAGNMSYLPGNGNANYKIGYQSLAGGLVNPAGGCSGATITVGP
jgi:hypothetical protein